MGWLMVLPQSHCAQYLGWHKSGHLYVSSYTGITIMLDYLF